MGDFREINVGVIEDRLMLMPLSTSDDNLLPEMIGAAEWGVAEKETQRIVSQFQATVVSDKRRRDVINYVQRLLKQSLGCEVFPYGSVPLKTYLPDGDIDLTAIGGKSEEDALANDIVSVLEGEVGNIKAEFVVKDVQRVPAEVKLVKCIVQNIVVDISINQIGGLCALCFLEQVDRVIGKDHLFKQSIILIKAWCYYESRILGAHHGLISTYALETLVLYIFQVFHSTLDGPLAVLYKFLDYFSKFDWETYCISLNGPVRISVLPDLSAEISQKGTHDLLLGKDFLKFCSENFSVPEMNSRAFPPKYLNIVDPLRDNNNLGRSVSKGNFYRIRSAFTFGAEKLGHILTSQVDDIASELRIFFSSTLVRHGSVQRPDVEVFSPRPKNEDGKMLNGKLKSTGFPIFFQDRVNEDAKDLATSKLEGLKISNERTKISPPRDKEIVRPSRMPPHAPHLYFSKEWSAYWNTKDRNLDENQSENFEKEKVVALQIPELNSSDLTGDYQSHLRSLHHGRWSFYEYLTSVRAGASMPLPLPPPPPPPPFEGLNLWDPLRNPFQQFKRKGFSHGNVNGLILNPALYIPSQMLARPVAFGLEEMPKHRGTGTYIPNPNRPPHGIMPSTLKGNNIAQVPRSPHTNNPAFPYFEPNMHDRSNLKEHLPQPCFPINQNLGSHQSYSLVHNPNPNAHGFIPHPETTAVESWGPLVPMSSRQPKSPASLRPQMAGQGSPAPTTQRLKSVPGPDRLMVKKSYHLKNEDDFPPLSF